MSTSFTLPYGYHEFNTDQGLNYQLNRFYSMGLSRLEDAEEAGKQIKSRDDWKVVMQKLAEQAYGENRLLHAAFYYRAAEFYLPEADPDKALFYEKFREYFEKAPGTERIERIEIPYGDTFLPAIRIAASTENSKGTLVVHGGNDSFIEEFYPLLLYFADAGYDVIGFEGPGQGNALKRYGLALDTEWEKPVAAVLDHLRLEEVTLLGISMGGWLCLRAAAFEPRVKRVIAWSVSYDVTRYANPFGRLIAGFLMKRCRGFVSGQMKKNMAKSPEYAWFMDNLMYITKKNEPIEAIDVLMQFTAERLHSERVKQDVLILTGKEDHLVPYKMHDIQVKALVNARSVTARVFTTNEQAQNHCQMGNLQLALDVMSGWMEQVDPA